MFVFVTSEPYFAEKFEGQIGVEELSNRLLVHEYGHTVQSLILGPLYLILIGIPSTLRGFLGAKERKEKQIPYGAFITEKWANSLGEGATAYHIKCCRSFFDTSASASIKPYFGGGALAGSKVDRSAAYMARKIAHEIGQAGYAEQCEIQIAYAVGMEMLVSVNVDCFGTEFQPLDFIQVYVENSSRIFATFAKS